jgi:hypothetical protein
MSRIACIGSRETPSNILRWMEEAGANLVRAGHTIVSGNAPGADQAWARGGNSVDPTKVELCLPWRDFELHAYRHGNRITPSDATAWRHAAGLHPLWDHLRDGPRRLLARNVKIVYGSTRVLGYLAGHGAGGTAFAFRIAEYFDVPTFDVARPEIREAFDYAAINGPVFP